MPHSVILNFSLLQRIERGRLKSLYKSLQLSVVCAYMAAASQC